MAAERKAEQRVSGVITTSKDGWGWRCSRCDRAEAYLASQSVAQARLDWHDELAHPLPTESEPERKKCHKIHCPQRPAWIPANSLGCPHCGGTATRAFCICETASADEIREMYTPPAPETPSPTHELARLAQANADAQRPGVTWLSSGSATSSPEGQFVEVRRGRMSVERICADCKDWFFLFAEASLFSLRHVDWPDQYGWQCSACKQLAILAAAKEQSK